MNEQIDRYRKPADLKTKAGNWYTCDMEVMNENMVTAFHRDEIYYCPKDGYLDVGGALFEVGCLDVFRLATEKEIPQPKQNTAETEKGAKGNDMEIPNSAWSEEDEENLNWFEKFFRAESVIAEGKDIPQDRYLWFKNLKNRVQPKQEWKQENTGDLTDFENAMSSY